MKFLQTIGQLKTYFLFKVPWHADEQLMPLVGKRIMITAPRQYATKLASSLIAAGARPVWLPSIIITHITDQDLSSVSQLLLVSASDPPFLSMLCALTLSYM